MTESGENAVIEQKRFSITDASLYGLRQLSQGDGLFLKLIVPVALALFVFSFLMATLQPPSNELQMETLKAAFKGTLDITQIQEQNQAQAAQMGTLILSSFLGLFMSCLLYAAAFRWLIRGKTKGLLGPFRFGCDELRLFGLILLYFVILIAIGLALMIPFGGVFFLAKTIIMGGGAGGSMAQTPANGVLGMTLLNLILIPLFIISFIWFAMRFSLAPALTIARRRFQFFKSWPLTKKITWKLIASFLMVFFLLTLVFGIPYNIIRILISGGILKNILIASFSAISGVIQIILLSGILSYALKILGSPEQDAEKQSL